MATDHLNFVFFEPDTAVQQMLRRFVMGFSIRADVDARMDWVTKPEQIPYLEQLVADVHIALLNADAAPYCIAAGRTILKANPQCLVVFYGKRSRDLASYFPARPIAYMDWSEQEADWDALFTTLHRQIGADTSYFSWTSKFCRYHIPCSQIITLRSNRGSLEIHTSGGVHTMTGKLDEAEKRLPPQDFLRVHKSTLVNVHKIQMMDRSDRCLLLQDGSRAYISKVHYKDVSEFVESVMKK